MYAHMNEHIYMDIHVHVRACIKHTCKPASIHCIYVNLIMFVGTYIYTYVSIHVYMVMSVYMYVYMYLCIHPVLFVYIHTNVPNPC